MAERSQVYLDGVRDGRDGLSPRLAHMEAVNADLRTSLAAARDEAEALRKAAEPVVAYVSRCHISRWLSGRADEERLLVAYGDDPNDAVALTMGDLRRLAARTGAPDDRR